MTTIGAGVTFGAGITITPTPSLVTNGLLLNFDAATYTGQETGPQQNVSGTSDNIGFFPYGWNSAPPTGFGNIAPGWICVQNGCQQLTVLALQLQPQDRHLPLEQHIHL